MATINREQLVTAALAIIDEQGSDALTMRTLAARVDRQVSSLYNHVGSRDELIEHVRARIVAGIDASAFADEPWDVALDAWARPRRARSFRRRNGSTSCFVAFVDRRVE